MADSGMAVYATLGFAAGETMTENVVDDIVMTVEAILVQDARTDRPQANRFGKILERETLGVPKPVFGLHQILEYEFMWNVAIVASGDRMMTGLLPAVVLIAHDVAIDAGLGIAAQIGKPFGILHRVCARSERDAEQRAQGQARNADPA